MQPIVVSDTQQDFNGTKYYLCGNYFQADGARLHRDVWAFHNGPIPRGKDWHIHHVDHDRANNNGGNLELITASEHMRHHHAGHTRPMPREAIEASKVWHASEAGADWHREHYKATGSALHAKTKDHTCTHCGGAFKSNLVDRAMFCGRNCRAAARRASGIDNEIRVCAGCGEDFTINRYKSSVHCGRSCANKARRA